MRLSPLFLILESVRDHHLLKTLNQWGHHWLTQIVLYWLFSSIWLSVPAVVHPLQSYPWTDVIGYVSISGRRFRPSPGIYFGSSLSPQRFISRYGIAQFWSCSKRWPFYPVALGAGVGQFKVFLLVTSDYSFSGPGQIWCCTTQLLQYFHPSI